MTPKKPDNNEGKRVNLYLRLGDVQRIRELSAFVQSKGLRSSDSLIVRAALEAAVTDKRFLAACEKAASADQRFRD